MKTNFSLKTASACSLQFRTRLLLAALLLQSCVGHVYSAVDYLPYFFRTLAGDSGIGANDGYRTAARFFFPTGIAHDAAGNIYIADGSNQVIRKVTPAGNVVTIAGRAGVAGYVDGPAGAALFNVPTSVAVDSSGNVFVAEYHDIRKISPDGTVSTIAGMGGVTGSADGFGSAARFHEPNGIALDASGNLYLADRGNHTIRRITPAGSVTTVAGHAGEIGAADGPSAAARFGFPMGVAITPAGDLYIADTGNQIVRKLASDGMVTTVAGMPGIAGSADGTGAAARFNYPANLAIDSTGIVWITDNVGQTIRRMTASGAVTTLAGRNSIKGSANGSGNTATFNFPWGITVMPDASILISDSGNNSIRLITPANVVTTFAGSSASGTMDGTGASARFCWPRGLVVDSAGIAFVADGENHIIRRITAGGDVTTFAGSPSNPGYVDGSAANARFNYPSGAAVDPAGNLFVADTRNNCIRRIASTGSVTTFAGFSTAGSADGTGTAARFYHPGAITLDGAGTLYVADTDNHTIRKIMPGGVVTTIAGQAGIAGFENGRGINARFNRPRGITINAAGELFVTDASSAVRKIASDGTVTTLAGDPLVVGWDDGTGAAARFFYPSGICSGSDSNVYVTDFLGSIRRITPSGVTATLAGAPAYGERDGLADRARFIGPVAIAADSAGKLYVADSNANTIRSGVATVQSAGMLSRKHETSSSGDWDIPLPLIGSPGVECRSGGPSGNFEVVFAFDASVSFSTASVTDGVGSVSSVDASNPSKIHVFLQNVTNAQRITVTLKNVSDGNLTNDVSAEMGVLLGDVTGDGAVNSADIAQTKSQSGQAVSSSNFRADVNVDGTLNSADIALVKSKSGTALP